MNLESTNRNRPLISTLSFATTCSETTVILIMNQEKPQQETMVLNYKPLNHGSVNFEDLSKGWEKTMEKGYDPTKPLKEEARKVQSRCNNIVSTNCILLSCIQEINDVNLEENSESRLDVEPLVQPSLDLKHQIRLRGTSPNFITRPTVLEQTAIEIQDNTTEGYSSDEILKETYDLLGLKFDSSDYKMQIPQSMAPFSRSRDRNCTRERAHRSSSCSKNYDRDDPSTSIIKSQDTPASTAPRKRSLGIKSISCPRNLGNYLPTIGETEVLDSRSHHRSSSTGRKILGGSVHNRSHCWSVSGSRKGKRRGKRSSLSLSDRNPKCLLSASTIGPVSSSSVSSRDETSPTKPNVARISRTFDRFTSCCEVPLKPASGSSQRPLKRISSLEPPKAPTRIVSPIMCIKNRKAVI
jgi:hypothetical protein